MASRLPRHTFDLYFQSSVEKTGFLDRLRKVREQLTPPGKPLLSHREFMLAMFDVVGNSNDKAMHKECLHYAYFSQCTKPVVICVWRKRQQRLLCRQLWMRCALSQTTLKGER